MKNKMIWKDVALIVLTILLIFSMCRIHTLHQSNKKLYSQNLELNNQLATLKEKNAGLESKLSSEENITDETKSDTTSKSDSEDTSDSSDDSDYSYDSDNSQY